MGRRQKPLKQRLLTKCRCDENGCWIWTGTVNGAGYGTIGLGGAELGKGFSHRVSYMVHHGDIPDGMLVCHRCDVKLCINPDHLFLGTYRDNVQDMIAKGRMNNLRTPARIESQPRGPSHGMAKLTEAEVLSIIDKFLEGETTKASLAKEFNVSRAMVRNIINGKNWKHLQRN